ncbi:hypothetical protein [Acinetobacter indicus]|nr:hypothetical protein [Acinetobacter indicus]
MSAKSRKCAYQHCQSGIGSKKAKLYIAEHPSYDEQSTSLHQKPYG